MAEFFKLDCEWASPWRASSELRCWRLITPGLTIDVVIWDIMIWNKEWKHSLEVVSEFLVESKSSTGSRLGVNGLTLVVMATPRRVGSITDPSWDGGGTFTDSLDIARDVKRFWRAYSAYLTHKLLAPDLWSRLPKCFALWSENSWTVGCCLLLLKATKFCLHFSSATVNH